LVALNKSAQANRDVKRSAREAFKELDEITGNRPFGDDAKSVAPQKGEEVSVVRPDGTTSTLNLMPVDNPEYRARRAEAIQKPGAVVGQVSINN
jgi:hypothetical protein